MSIVKRRRGLAIRLLATVVITAISISVATILIGSGIHWNSIVSLYDDKAKEVTAAVKTVLTPDEYERYSDLALRYAKGKATDEEVNALVNSERYQYQKELLNGLRECLNLTDIYIVVYDIETVDAFTEESYEARTWKPFVYLFDCYYDPEGAFPFGASSPIDKANKDMLRDKWVTGQPLDAQAPIVTYFEASQTWILSGVSNIVVDGKSVAFIGAEVALPRLEQSMQQFLWSTILADIAMLFIMLSLSLFYVSKSVIQPIKLVADSAGRFVENNTEISEELKTIKTKDELQMLGESLLSLESDMHVYIADLTRMTSEKERVVTELQIAERIQRGMLSTDFVIDSSVDIYASMKPAREVGGDFYDFFKIDNEHIGLVMADVSGKGVPASIFMAITKVILHNEAMNNLSPAAALYTTNNIICVNDKSAYFVTVWLGILNIKTGELVCSSAGHEYPAIKRNGKYELIEAEQYPPVATMENMEYVDRTIQLSKGDAIFLYTDGIPEAKAPDGSRFTIDAMLDVLNKVDYKDSKSLIDEMQSQVDAFMDTNEQFDDVTMLNIILK